MLNYIHGGSEARKALDLADKRLPGISKLAAGKEVLIAADETKEIYFVSHELFKIYEILSKQKHPYTIGFYFGKINHVFEPSFGALSKYVKISEYHKVVISRKAEMKFLYGRDVKADQLRKFDKELKKDNEVIVCNKSGEAIGLGRLLLDPKSAKRADVVIKNTMDLGWYLRHKE